MWKLPVVFVIENNRYAMGTAVTRSHARAEELFARGALRHSRRAGGRHGCVRAVKKAADKAVRHGRTGQGPFILEMLTYRYRGHSMSDPAKYRSREEVQKMREEHDPIEQVKARLLEKGSPTSRN